MGDELLDFIPELADSGIMGSCDSLMKVVVGLEITGFDDAAVNFGVVLAGVYAAEVAVGRGDSSGKVLAVVGNTNGIFALEELTFG